MVAEPREEYRSRDTRKGDGVAARFRPLGGDGPDRPETPSAPAFGTAPWGYKRAEVDAWMSWMSGLVEHGRKETLRADSAEATLKATLDQLEQLHSLETSGVWPSGAADRSDGNGAPAQPNGPTTGRAAEPSSGATDDATTADAPDRSAAASGAPPSPTTVQPDGHPAANPDGNEPEAGEPAARTPEPLPRRLTRAADPDPAQADDRGPAEPAPSADPPPDTRTAQDPRTGPGPRPGAATVPDRDPDRPELARLQVVETTLHEVMGLLNRLVESGRGPDRPRDDGR